MFVGTNTYPFLWNSSLEDSLQKLNNLGIKNAEILFSPPHLSFDEVTLESLNRIKHKAAVEGITIKALNMPGQDINIASPYPEMRAYTVDKYKRLISIAKHLGTPYVLMHPGRLHPLLPPDFNWVWEKTRPNYEELIRYAEKNQVSLLIENMPSLFFQTSKDIKWLLQELKSDYFGAIYDVSNGYMVEDPADGIRLLGNDIHLIHLNDTSRKKWEHNVVGENEIDFRSIFLAIREIGYIGDCILEIIPKDAEKGILDSLQHLIRSGWFFDI
jgi:sugar phosphate isomerase/epimerase